MNTRQIRKKIKSFTNIKKITKAMQLVSAVKSKKAQAVFSDSTPYSEHIQKMLKKIMKTSTLESSPLFENREEGRDLTVFITSDKGLCGAFNYNLFKYALKNTDLPNSDFITIGRKGAIFISKMGAKLIADYSDDRQTEVSALFQLTLKFFLEKKYRKIMLVYNKFISALRIIPTGEKLLPISFDDVSIDADAEFETDRDYLIEPKGKEVLDSLLQSYVQEKIRFALLNNEVGEHSARMIAMKNATDNATDLIFELTLLSNKIRQEKITNELLDITTAKESVEQI